MSTRRALAFSFLDRYAALAIAIGSSMAIARLLTPTEIGVYSVTMVLVSFTMSLRDFGAGQYLVQEKELTPDRIRATWTVQLLVGLAFSLVTLCAAWPVSWFYGDPRMMSIMLVVALNFAVNPFGSMTYAWLMREMRFEALALMRVSAMAAGAAVSIGLAWSGHGPISLAFGNLASTCVNAGIAVLLRPAHFPWMPGRRELRRVLDFGGKLSGASMVRTLGDGAPELLLGKLQGLTAAGLFSRASGLTQMFNRLLLDAVVVVAQPLFARTHRETGHIGPVFLQTTSYVTALGWSFFIGMALLAHPVMRLLYGAQWDAAVPVARVLCMSAAVALPAALCPVTLVATGAVNRSLRLTLISSIVTVAALALGALHSLLGAACALLAAQCINTWLWISGTLQHLQVKPSAWLRTTGASAALSAGTSVVPLAICALAGWEPARGWASVLAAVGIGIPSFTGLAVALSHPIAAEIRTIARRIGPRSAG